MKEGTKYQQHLKTTKNLGHYLKIDRPFTSNTNLSFSFTL